MDFLSSPDVAAKYGIPLRTVQAACQLGNIKATRIGRMYLIPPEEAEAYAQRWRPHHNGHSPEGVAVEHSDDVLYGVAEQQIVRRDLTPGQAVWTLDPRHNGRVLRPSGLVGFDQYQPRAWQEVKDLFDVSRLSAPETPNGPGSTVALTEEIRAWLPGLFRRRNVTSMLDAPCGDWNWMRLVDLGSIEYLGWDVVPALVAQCARRVINGATATNAVFECVNLLTVPQVPTVDLILSRDFLAHLPNEVVLRVLDKFIASGSRYLLTSHYPGESNDFDYRPEDFAWIGYAERPVNLEAPPFSLGAKLESIAEIPGPAGVINLPHELALFQL